jgi:hypothetical protein
MAGGFPPPGRYLKGTSPVASPVILAPSRGAVTSAASQARRDADGYARFRSIIDDYEEAPRPSLQDVEGVASVLSDALGPVQGQESFSTARFVAAKFWHGRHRSAHDLAGIDLTEGRSWRVRVSPGVVGLRSYDALLEEKRIERERQAVHSVADLHASHLAVTGELPDFKPGAGEIVEWSARSRANLSETVGSLDFSDWDKSTGALAMVTLTLPGDWLAVAPDGKTFKKMLRKFRFRWEHSTGLPWRLLWKLEFQDRGAPHWHALMRVPVLVKGEIFERWLSRTWADVVDASKDIDGLDKWGRDSSEYLRHLSAGTRIDFSGQDFSDPRRIALYFLGHSMKTTDGKEYQHKVPRAWRNHLPSCSPECSVHGGPGSGPGRFWGHAGMKKAVVEIAVSAQDVHQLARQLRKVKKARAWKTAVLRAQGQAKREALPAAGSADFTADPVHRLGRGQKRSHVPGAFYVDAPKAKKSRGRSAHRTYNRKRYEAFITEMDTRWLFVADMGAKPEFRRHPRFVGSSLASGGYQVGGWVLVNDALELTLDLARWIQEAQRPAHTALAYRCDIMARCVVPWTGEEKWTH